MDSKSSKTCDTDRFLDLCNENGWTLEGARGDETRIAKCPTCTKHIKNYLGVTCLDEDKYSQVKFQMNHHRDLRSHALAVVRAAEAAAGGPETGGAICSAFVCTLHIVFTSPSISRT